MLVLNILLAQIQSSFIIENFHTVAQLEASSIK